MPRNVSLSMSGEDYGEDCGENCGDDCGEDPYRNHLRYVDVQCPLGRVLSIASSNDRQLPYNFTVHTQPAPSRASILDEKSVMFSTKSIGFSTKSHRF